MSLILHSYCAYPSYREKNLAFRQQDWDSMKFIKALKGKAFKDYAWIRDVDGKNVKLTSGNSALPIRVFGNWAAQRLRERSEIATILVPVPSSDHTDFEASFLPKTICESVATFREGTKVMPVLAFKSAKHKDHEATHDSDNLRRQSEDELAANLICSTERLTERVILVDDMCTNGRHLRVCARRLRSLGATVETALCPGRTVWDHQSDNFNLAPEDLEPQDERLANFLRSLFSKKSG